ncbi:MAG: DegQ family serine endoprotease [Bauldia litoralis]
MHRILGTLAALALTVAAMPGASAQTVKTIPDTMAQVRLSFAPVVKRVTPAVVNIRTRTQIPTADNPLMRDPVYRRFFDPDGNPRRRPGSLGSGVIVRANGTIITNNHVIRNAAQIKVLLADKREYEATVLLKDKRTDIAVLKIKSEGQTFPFLQLRDADELEVGDIVIAVGNPFGVGQTVTMGIVSALARTTIGITDYRFFIQTDAAINPGNSGGPLVTLDGRVVGINTAIYSRTGGSVGIGFAIPSNMVRAVLRGAETGGKLRRPWLGIAGQTVSADIAKSLGLKTVAGVLLVRIVSDSPAAKAGLKQRDVVTAIDGRDVADIQALRFRLATMSIGGTIKLSVIRGGKSLTVTVPLRSAPEVPPRTLTFLKGRQPLSGAQVGNLSPGYAEELGIRRSSGVIIVKLRRDAIAAHMGFRPGDIILEVNGRQTRTIKALTAALGQSEYGTWRFAIERGGRRYEFTRGL